jgi:hypothetical protein
MVLHRLDPQRGGRQYFYLRWNGGWLLLQPSQAKATETSEEPCATSLNHVFELTLIGLQVAGNARVKLATKTKQNQNKTKTKLKIATPSDFPTKTTKFKRAQTQWEKEGGNCPRGAIVTTLHVAGPTRTGAELDGGRKVTGELI